ncbi:O-linked N-acetylglucosamine transferase family protein [Chromohalobacter israelensis]|uniref:protein O-GlcNAc transferase n=1 Tax=Chromohalobacter israelensis (strain ATCC BAA-138 / DSM 3043 / CIP 106854 / NCIMB 13768 / 1H11) TaxID=290398 RepID=Q1QW20_CHRI1|nr:sulfotransferase [Chromohalobacter salexigens]ABE59338.1 sulfotransferase [Chromohalobacter salexigens DSM 3043]
MSKKRHSSSTNKLTLPQARKQVQRHPTDPDAWLTLGKLQAGQKEFYDAKASLEKARELRPNHHEQEEWLGYVAHKQHRLQDALQHLQDALELAPNSAFGLATLSYLYLDMGKPYKSIEYAKKAWQFSPKSLRVLDSLANSLSALYRYNEALDIYDQLIKLTPSSYIPWNSAGNMYRELGLLNKAYRCYQKASALAPHNAIPYSNHLTALHYDPRASRTEIAAFAKSWEKRFAPEKSALSPRPARVDKSYQRHLKVGLLSDGLRNHPVGKMIVRCLENIPPNQMTLVAYSSSEIDDALTRRIKNQTHTWYPIRHLNDDDLVQQIRDDEIDVLIDLSGHNAGTRMRAIAMQPAPLLVKWVGGLINTTGVQAIDYLISDHVETPGGEDEYYTEKLIRLPDDYIVFDPPAKLPALRELPAKRNGYITLACFNNPTKLNDVTLKQWAGIMHELPDSRLMLKGRPYTSESFCERLYATLEAAGIARERLIIEGPGSNYEMLDAYNRADIALDPWPYSGGLTTCEAFIMGVPVVTLPGPTFAGRHSATHLVHAGMPELVVNSWDEYRARVIELASDLESLGTIRQHLRDVLLQSPVCDGPRFAKHFTDAMRAIWQRYCDDKAPASLTFNKEGEARFEDEDVPVEIHYAEAPEDDSTFQWQFDGKLIAVDNGGQLLESDVVRQLLQKEALELIAFDPSSQAPDTSLKQHKGVHYYPNATLGDGQPGQLHACLDPKLSASLAPLDDEYQPEAIRKGSQVLTRLPLNTIALDSIQGLPAIDWLVLDGLNDASAILDNGTQALKDTLLLQVKVAFQPTHERQPNLAEIQHWASRNGFRLYRLHEPQHRSHLPEEVPEAQRQATELTSADALLLPSYARMEALSDNQRMRLAFLLHSIYGIKDITYNLLENSEDQKSLSYLHAEGLKKIFPTTEGKNEKYSANESQILDKTIFVVGCGHSGTTLMASLLGAHPEVHTIPRETYWFLNNPNLNNEYYQEKRKSRREGKSIVCEKTPRHIYKIKEIKEKFPNAQIIAMTRDSKDVVSSLKKRSGNFEHSVQRWISDNKALLEFKNESWIKLVKYENLVTRKESVVHEILSFLDLTYTEEVFDFHKKNYKWFGIEDAKKTDGRGEENHISLRSWQMTQPIHDNRGVWKKGLSKKEVAIVDAKCKNLEKTLDFTKESTSEKGKIKVFGDSHIQSIQNINKNSNEESLLVHVIHGATILGLGKRKSTLETRKKITNSLNPNDFVTLGFGQVDLELGFYYRKIIKKERISPNYFFDLLIENYKRFIIEIKNNCAGVVIKGVNLPVLKEHDAAVSYVSRIITENISCDTTKHSLLAELRSKYDSYESRAIFALELNKKIKGLAKDTQCEYFDINSYISKESTNEVDNKYIPENIDHHILVSEDLRSYTVQLIEEKVRQLIAKKK